MSTDLRDYSCLGNHQSTISLLAIAQKMLQIASKPIFNPTFSLLSINSKLSVRAVISSFFKLSLLFVGIS